MNLPRLPKQEFYGQEERFKMALAIAPIILKEMLQSQVFKKEINEKLPVMVVELTDTIINELKKWTDTTLKWQKNSYMGLNLISLGS